MNCHDSSHRSNSAWKIALIFVFSFAQLGWMPGAVDHAQAAPQEPAPPAVPNAADPPIITLGGLGNAMIGSSITFTVTFDNNDPENEPGYGPFIELELPTVGVDGNDGLTFVSASYLASPIPAQIFLSAPSMPAGTPLIPWCAMPVAPISTSLGRLGTSWWSSACRSVVSRRINHLLLST